MEYKRLCRECPRRLKSITDYEYYCQGKGKHFSGEEAFCYCKRPLNKSRKMKRKLNNATT